MNSDANRATTMNRLDEEAIKALPRLKTRHWGERVPLDELIQVWGQLEDPLERLQTKKEEIEKLTNDALVAASLLAFEGRMSLVYQCVNCSRKVKAGPRSISTIEGDRALDEKGQWVPLEVRGICPDCSSHLLLRYGLHRADVLGEPKPIDPAYVEEEDLEPVDLELQELLGDQGHEKVTVAA